jgi:hypothetical protein
MTGRRAGYRRSIPVLVVALAILALWSANAQAAIVGLEQVTRESPLDSSNKGITATCPAGKRLLGTGAAAGPPIGQVLIDDIQPDAGLTSLTVNAREDETGTTANWRVSAIAICATPPSGLVRASATSASDSSNKTITVNCPSGKRVLSVAGEINSPDGQVLLEGLRPLAGLASARVKAIEDENGYAASWSLTAYAICANPIAGLGRVALTYPPESGRFGFVDAFCPAGKEVVGTGGDINSPNGQIVLDSVSPFQVGTSVGATEDETGNTANWSLTAYAICANSAERAQATGGPPEPVHPAAAKANCPSGKQVTGAGHEIQQAGLRASYGRVIHSLRPDPSPPTSVNAVAFQHGNPDAVDPAYLVTAYAICASPLPGLTLVSATSPSDSTHKSVTASCPSGKKVVGVGGAVQDGFRIEFEPPFFEPRFVGEVVMSGLFPNAALTNVQVNAFEEPNGFEGNWSLTAHAICANPPPGLALVSATSAPTSAHRSVAATCPAGKNLLGTGALASHAQVIIDDLRPAVSLKSVTVFGVEDPAAPTSDFWTVSAYAICANP